MGALVAMPGGRLDDILDPERLMPIPEIARVLSRVCRWGGRGSAFYSVLQHSVELARALPEDLRLQGLLHDFSEAWIGDIPAPLKKTPQMAFLREAEETLQQRLWERYGGFSELHPLVMEYDSRIALDEAIALNLSGEWVGKSPKGPLGVDISPLPPEAAFSDFAGAVREFGFFRDEQALFPQARPAGTAARARCR